MSMTEKKLVGGVIMGQGRNKGIGEFKANL